MKKIYFLFYLFLFYFYYHRLSDLSNKHFSQIWSLEFQHQYTSRFRVWWEPTFWLTDVLLLSVSSHGGRAGVLSAAAAKSLQSCPTLCDLIDGSPPGSPSLGFSRKEHWSGLPSPSPTQENEKWKWSRSVVSDPQRPHGLQPSRLIHPWDFPGKSTGVGCHCLLHNIYF